MKLDSESRGLQYILKPRKPFERARQAAWDKRNLRTVSTHVTRREAGTFKLMCRRRGTTPYTVLQNFVRAYIADEANWQ